MDGDQSMMRLWEEFKAQTPLSHSLILGSGKRLDVNLLIDWINWSVQDLRPINNLDELAFNFDRVIKQTSETDTDAISIITVAWFLREKKTRPCVVPIDTAKIEFTIKINDTEVKIPFEGCYQGIRLPVGSLLCALLNESHILYQNESRKAMDSKFFDAHPTVVITMKEEPVDLSGKTVNIGTQCLKLDNGMVQILPEVYGLHSPFFLSLLFGNFHEANGGVIALRGARVQELRLISLFLSAFKSNYDKCEYPWTDLSQIADFYRLLDRLLIPIPISIEPRLTRFVTTEFIKQKDYPVIIELSQIQSRLGRGSANIMETFLNRFAFARCITKFIDYYKDLITPPMFPLLSKRIAKLVSQSYRRPKFSVEIADGSCVVEVPTDYDAFQKTAEVVRRIVRDMSSTKVFHWMETAIVSSAHHDQLPFLLMDSDAFLDFSERHGVWPPFQAMVVLGQDFRQFSWRTDNLIHPFHYD